MNTVTPEQIESKIVEEKYIVIDGTTTTIAYLTLANGFKVIGESACADPAIFDAEVGRSYARKDAVRKIWPLEGYLLKERLSLVQAVEAPTGKMAGAETFVGTKVVHAKPMTRKAYNELRGWEVPADENPDDVGYLVEYTDGGQANVEGFKGYISWSPKEVFEGSYKVGVVLKESTFVSRLEKELDDLMEKLVKLRAFMSSKAYANLSITAQEDLRVQAPIMESYAGILRQRLFRLTNTAK